MQFYSGKPMPFCSGVDIVCCRRNTMPNSDTDPSSHHPSPGREIRRAIAILQVPHHKIDYLSLTLPFRHRLLRAIFMRGCKLR